MGPLKTLCADVVGDELFSLLDGLLFSNPVVRSAAIEALFAVPLLMSGAAVDDPHVSALLLLAANDVDEHNSAHGQELLAASGATVTQNQLEILSPLIGHRSEDVRKAAVNALVQFLQAHPIMTQKLIDYTIDTITSTQCPPPNTLPHD